MPRDPIARLDAQAWVAKAELDLRAAKLDLSVDPPLLADAAFHCQQAAEKSLKGILALHDRPFRKTHDIGELAGVAIQVQDAIAQSALRALDSHSWRVATAISSSTLIGTARTTKRLGVVIS